jgi:UPF0755 protein
MTQRPDSRAEIEERRNARIRQLREQREGPIRRRRQFQPAILLAWFAGVIVLAGVALWLGFTAFAPSLMAWVEDHPGSIDNGLVRDFVEWYQPEALADEPASDTPRRVTFTVVEGDTDSQIGQALFDAGLIRSQLAFQVAVQAAGREGTLAAGTYDLSPTLRPSAIVAALRQFGGPEITIRIGEGWRLEEIIGYLGSTELTMSLDQFADLALHPDAELISQYDFLAGLPVGRSLEGYLYPDTYQVEVNASAIDVLDTLLGEFGDKLTPEIRAQITGRTLGGSPMTIDDAVILASIVEREAVLNEERPLIAGVYTNRLDFPNAETVGLLNADPTLQYALATAEHGTAPMSDWGSIEWWPQLQVSGGEVALPDALAGYQTYLNPGKPPTPIAAPRIGSIAAVAAPSTGDGFFYFVAGCPNGQRDGSHYFASTLTGQNQNIARANEECAGA